MLQFVVNRAGMLSITQSIQITINEREDSELDAMNVRTVLVRGLSATAGLPGLYLFKIYVNRTAELSERKAHRP